MHTVVFFLKEDQICFKGPHLYQESEMDFVSPSALLIPLPNF